MSFQTRRTFLQSVGAASAALLPHSGLRFGKKSPSYWFVHAATQDSWPVDDPLLWSLKNARRPILEMASERLLKLTPDDGDRIIRLVVRRCRLNLLELHPDQVVVHHWGQRGPADLRPFFKQHGLARPQIEVVRRDRKKEVRSHTTGIELHQWWTERLDATEAPGAPVPAPEAAISTPPWPPRPKELAEWPIEKRQKWGELANRLEDEDVPWPAHEQIAFSVIAAESEPRTLTTALHDDVSTLCLKSPESDWSPDEHSSIGSDFLV
jgi:hypothetical protein